jgi:hypothetical protein
VPFTITAERSADHKNLEDSMVMVKMMVMIGWSLREEISASFDSAPAMRRLVENLPA